MSTLLEKINQSPGAIKQFTRQQLEQLSQEIRNEIINVVSSNGGHLASNLGIVEITVALHYILNIPPDRIIFDVGHQTYSHKLLTGRFSQFSTLRKYKGVSGFPNPEESETDLFLIGHAGTAISAALGLQTIEERNKGKTKTVVVIGDGSLTNGVTFEGLNNLGSSGKDILVILNDNNFSISRTRGALSYYLTKLVTMPALIKSKEEIKEIIEKIPAIGEQIVKLSKDLEQKTKHLIIPGVFFEKLGIQYFGPIDGNDINQILDVLPNLLNQQGPKILHAITKKGKGYIPAEKNPEKYHSIGPFNIETGEVLINTTSTGTFVGKILEKYGEKYDFYVITSAMEYGLGFDGFAKKFPDRFFDVGIAESHSLIFAGGIAKTGKKVFVGIYSTFLQRAYDQVFHDVCLQNLPVVILVDRAGIVSGDGPTHQGIYDLAFLRSIPGITIFCPYSLKNIEEVLQQSLNYQTPVVIRYPRDLLPEDVQEIKNNGKILCLSPGSMAEIAYQACMFLNQQGLQIDFMPVSRICPLEENVENMLLSYKKIITCEETMLAGGFGSLILEICNQKKLSPEILRIGIPDTFVETGSREELLKNFNLDKGGIIEKVKNFYENI
ncbi:MAG TPA: 1-deoxy-D-xylulose-5-phosphate synthase [bacterium]|nr:1-deoxy-D-xylulose-5-phosphate synthase [bacterium]HOL34302.1 1-deoxy-D-xylulose-5-phosphate synthase [bacterium]HPP08608.1 1-deoxy-D-xylulose-5-phosphate synthase [bacterium]